MCQTQKAIDVCMFETWVVEMIIKPVHDHYSTIAVLLLLFDYYSTTM